MAVKTKAPKPLIKAASIATAIDKITGKVLGWAVKSNSSSQYYQVRSEIIGDTRVFFCDCDAHLWGCAECCHIKAIQEVLVAKAELMQHEAEAAVAEAEKIVTAQPVIAEQGVIEAPIFPQAKEVKVKRSPAFTNRENYALTSNAGFSLLKR
jgi:hypothetical protein